MKMFIKLIIILVLILFVSDIAASFYFYDLSMARTKKEFLRNDSALMSTSSVEATSALNATADALPANAKVFSSAVIIEDEKAEIDWFNKQPYEEVNITSDDGLNLVGYYLPAVVPSGKTAILAHGYSAQGTYMGSYAKIYYDMGYNVLLPDDRGHGKSDGNYIGFGWADRKDYIKWINYIIDSVGRDSQIILHGVSMGGATVLMTSGENIPDNVKAIVSDCAYTSVWDELEYQIKRMYNLPAFPILNTTSFLSKIKAGYSFEEASALKQVKSSKTPTLFIHGDADKFVPFNMVNELYQACSSEKDIFIVPGAGHGDAYNTDTAGYKNKVREFVNKYIK